MGVIRQDSNKPETDLHQTTEKFCNSGDVVMTILSGIMLDSFTEITVAISGNMKPKKAS